MQRNKVMSLLGLVIIASMLLAACAQATPVEVVKTVVVTNIVAGTPQVSVVTATPVPPTAAPTKAPAKAQDTIIIGMQQEPDTLHPSIGSMLAKTIVLAGIFPGCMGQDETTKWVPLGCETVPTLENGGAALVGDGADKHLEVTYKIRKGWRWTDGTPVTSKDAVYYWKLIMDPKFEVADRTGLEKIFDVTAVDDSTFKYVWMSQKQLNEAAAGTLTGNVDFKTFAADYEATYGKDWKQYAVDPVYWAYASWLPSHILESIPADQQAASDFAKMPVGDGPYQVKEWKQGQELTMVASDKPFPLGDPKIKTVIFRFFTDPAGVITALQTGEIDVATGNTAGITEANGPDLDKIEAAGDFKVYYVPGYAWEHIDLNTTKFPLDDQKVRQALYQAIDKQAIVDKLYFGKKVPTALPIPKGMSWADTEDYTKYPYDVDAAKKLLADAGWDCKALPCTKDGKKLEITLMTTDRADRQALAQVVQSMWKKINVGANLQFLYGRGLFATADQGGPLSARTFDAAIYTWVSGDDPGFYTLYSCTSIPSKDNGFAGQNYPGWCNQKANDALNNSENNPDVTLYRDKRMPYITTFFQEWTKDIPVIPLFNSAEPFVARVGLKNFKPGPTQYDTLTWNIWEWELEK